MATNSCALCNYLIECTEKCLNCNICKSNVDYVSISLPSEELEKIDQKNWMCNLCISTGDAYNSSNIIELFQQICDGQKSHLERITLPEEKINRSNKKIGDLSNQLSISLKENAFLKEKLVILENKIFKLESCNITVNHTTES